MSDKATYSREAYHTRHREKMEQFISKMISKGYWRPTLDSSLITWNNDDNAHSYSSEQQKQSSDTKEEEELTSNKYNTQLASRLETIVKQVVKGGAVNMEISDVAYDEITKQAQHLAHKFIFSPSSNDDFLFDYNTQLQIVYFTRRLGRFAEDSVLGSPELVDVIIDSYKSFSFDLVNVLDDLSELVLVQMEEDYKKSITSILFDAVGAVYYKSNIPEIVQAYGINCANLYTDVALAAKHIMNNIAVLLDEILTDTIADAFEAMHQSQDVMDKVTKGVEEIHL